MLANLPSSPGSSQVRDLEEQLSAKNSMLTHEGSKASSVAWDLEKECARSASLRVQLGQLNVGSQLMELQVLYIHMILINACV